MRRKREYKKKKRVSRSFHNSKESRKDIFRKRTLFKRLSPIFTKTNIVIGLIGAVLTLVGFKDQIHKWFTSTEDIYIEENYFKGILIPESHFDPKGALTVKYGGNVEKMYFNDLVNGTQFKTSGFRFTEGVPFHLEFLLKNSRLFISTYFKDLQKGEIIGTLNYNNWSLFKSNLFLWYQDDQTLEVMDRSHNIVFRLRYQSPATIEIQGYFVGSEYVTIVYNEGITEYRLSDKGQALKVIERIKPMFIRP